MAYLGDEPIQIQVEKLFRYGLPKIRIADHFETSNQTIIRVLMGEYLDWSRNEKIFHAKKLGMKTNHIANHFKLDETTILRICRKMEKESQ